MFRPLPHPQDLRGPAHESPFRLEEAPQPLPAFPSLHGTVFVDAALAPGLLLKNLHSSPLPAGHKTPV